MDSAIGILVIDDDTDGRELMADLLRRAGYEVATACNGCEGLERLHEAAVPPALILLDIHMPVMDGPHFREAQRQDPVLLEIPTVVMTSDPDLNPVLDLAIARTVKKPFRRGELLEIVEQLCRRAA